MEQKHPRVVILSLVPNLVSFVAVAAIAVSVALPRARQNSTASEAFAVTSLRLAPAECEQLIEQGMQHHIRREPLSETSLGARTRERVSETWWLCAHTTSTWATSKFAGLANRIHLAVLAANRHHWNLDGLDVSGMEMKMLRYATTDGGKFLWHTDAGPDKAPRKETRLLTVTLQLSDADAYEGGDLLVGAVNMKAASVNNKGPVP
jgi:hypothetical protein